MLSKRERFSYNGMKSAGTPSPFFISFRFTHSGEFNMKQRLFSLLAIAAISLLAVLPAGADVRLPEIFDSGMVFQREMNAPVWGWADAGEKVTVTFAGQTESATAGADGRWMVELKPLKPGGPFPMTNRGKNEIKLDDVLVGDVWLCSGQSNMEWAMSWLPDSKADIPQANHPNIRLFQVEKAWTQRPQDSLKAKWTACTPETVGAFSAVGYYFGKNLHAELDVPIGLINSSWGGTRIEPWTPPVGFYSVPALSEITDEVNAKDPAHARHKELAAQTLTRYKNWISETEKNLAEEKPLDPPPTYPGQLAPWGGHQSPTVLYNAMVSPFTPLGMRGAIWYQGESNLGEGMLYAEKMRALIQGWRSVLDNDDFGFYFVQLAPYNYGGDGTRLPLIWEAQASVERDIPKTGMAVINDIGNLKDIHPAHKSVVGKRLALLALNRTYGKTDIACASPELGELTVDGNEMILAMKNAEELKTRDGKEPDWFEIAGADGVYHKATVKIEKATLRLSSPQVVKPYAVRFAWDQLAEPNLQNEAGLPLGAFRAGEIPERGNLDTLVPEARNFKLVYSFDPTSPVMLDGNSRFAYRTDKSSEIVGKVKRVGYFLSLTPKDGDMQYVFVTTPPLDQNLAKLGVPTKNSGARFQQNVPDVTVKTNVSGVESGTFADGCNVEFWDCNYAAPNKVNVPNASNDVFDFGDEMNTGNSPGYGSMQIHNHAKKQTIFSFSNFNAGKTCDVGIGNCPRGNNPDWTFSRSAETYVGGQLLILVEME